MTVTGSPPRTPRSRGKGRGCGDDVPPWQEGHPHFPAAGAGEVGGGQSGGERGRFIRFLKEVMLEK